MKRILRHLWYGAPQLRARFPAGSLERIAAAIAASEARHGGEIRFAVEASLDTLPLLRGVTALERAVDVFSELRVWDTERNNGVLIYVMLADHDVEIVADRGIDARVGAAGWEAACQAMEAEFRAGRFEAGVIRGIEAVGRHLERHFPGAAGDRDELPNRPAVL